CPCRAAPCAAVAPLVRRTELIEAAWKTGILSYLARNASGHCDRMSREKRGSSSRVDVSSFCQGGPKPRKNHGLRVLPAIFAAVIALGSHHDSGSSLPVFQRLD